MRTWRTLLLLRDFEPYFMVKYYTNKKDFVLQTIFYIHTKRLVLAIALFSILKEEVF